MRTKNLFSLFKMKNENEKLVIMSIQVHFINLSALPIVLTCCYLLEIKEAKYSVNQLKERFVISVSLEVFDT